MMDETNGRIEEIALALERSSMPPAVAAQFVRGFKTQIVQTSAVTFTDCHFDNHGQGVYFTSTPVIADDPSETDAPSPLLPDQP